MCVLLSCLVEISSFTETLKKQTSGDLLLENFKMYLEPLFCPKNENYPLQSSNGRPYEKNSDFLTSGKKPMHLPKLE